MKEFELAVPEDYSHEDELALAYKKGFENESSEYTFNEYIATRIKKSDQLVPGNIYEVKLFEASGTFNSADGHEFLKNQRSMYIGLRGALAVVKYKKDELPADKSILYPDYSYLLGCTYSNSGWSLGYLMEACYLSDAVLLLSIRKKTRSQK